MKILNLEGLTDYNTKLLNKVDDMIDDSIGDCINDVSINESSIIFSKKDGTNENITLPTNADTVDGVHAWEMRTLSSIGQPHGESDWLMRVQHDIDGDGYFKIFCGDGSIQTKVDKASLSTNATNSDTLDGYHGDSYIFSYENYGANYFGSYDLNTWTRSGSYAIQSGCTNTPAERGTDTWGTILIIKGLSDRISQYAVFWNETNQPLWHRCLNGSSWTTWVRVRDGGNANTANSSTYSNYMAGWGDNRHVNTIPNDYNSKFEVKGLKSNSSINSPDNSSFSTVMGVRAWYDSTGGEAHELAFTGNGQMFQRHGSTDTWSSWNRLYTSENITCGTTSLTSGSSSLASGNIYLQYE